MPCSEANQNNGRQPKELVSYQEKLTSRRNSLKSGYTGECLAIPDEDPEALEAKLAAFEEALKPQDAVQMDLAKRFGLMSIRLERLARQEAKATSYKMRNAPSEFDDARMAEVDHLISWIGHEPVTNSRRLMRSPLGISRLITIIEGLRSDLMRQPTFRWTHQHCDQFHHYLGKRREEMPVTRIRALTEAIQGQFHYIDPEEIPETEITAKRRWAIREMVELIDGEIAKLKALLETFDPTAIERDRAEAADRSIFDPSTERVLARKHEAACERSMYKAYKELKAMQADAAQAEPQPEVTDEPAEKLGSFFPNSSGKSNAKANDDPTPSTEASPAAPVRPSLEKLARKGGRRGMKS